jgi:microcin C transport system permease protein
MRRYFLRRLALLLPTWLGITVVVFFLIQLTPGGPFDAQLAQWRSHSENSTVGMGELSLRPEVQKELAAYYGFDRPLGDRYVHWLGNWLRGDWGISYQYGRPVRELLRDAIGVTLLLGLGSWLLAYWLALPLGIAKAVWEGSRFDSVTSALLFFLHAVPSFAIAIALLLFFAGGSVVAWLPADGLRSEVPLPPLAATWDLAKHLVLPVLSSALGIVASLTFLTKHSLLEQTRAEYVTAARARGLSSTRAIVRHALRNAGLPIAGSFGQSLSYFLTGSVLTETIFSLRGLGRLGFEATLSRDYPVLLACVMLVGTLHLFVNLLCDLLYARLDPRVDFAPGDV